MKTVRLSCGHIIHHRTGKVKRARCHLCWNHLYPDRFSQGERCQPGYGPLRAVMAVMSSEWGSHPPRWPNQCGHLITCPTQCTCGIKEAHEHCSGCGKLVSVGSGDVIAKYTLPLKGGQRP
jgi:hypothetical protein